MDETSTTPPEGFSLDAEQSREDEAAQSGIVAREVDPVDDIGDPAELAAEPGDAPDDNDIDDPDEDGPEEDI